MKPLVAIRNLSLTVGGNRILDRVSLSLAAGEYVSIVGQNGAGKSTLIKCLAGICADWRGDIEIDGVPLRSLSQRRRGRLLSYVPQADARVLPFTVEEFVTMGRYPYLSPFTTVSPEDRAAVERALRMTEVEQFRARWLGTLSGGERQKVFIAAAVAQGARIVLLDEPTTFLDYRHQHEILALLGSLNRESGTTVLAVYHDLNSAVAWSHRIVGLKNGRLAFSGTAADTLDPAVLRNLFEVDFSFVEGPEGIGRLALAAAGRAAP